MELNLSVQERSVLECMVQQAKPRYARRAGALLACEEDLALDQIVDRIGLSRRTVRYWLDRFVRERMGVFPAGVLWAYAGDAESRPQDTTIGPTIPLTPAGWLQQCEIDATSGQHVAGLAGQLWLLTREVHRCEQIWRDLLQTAALLHDLGLEQGEIAHHQAVVEPVLESHLEGLDDKQRRYLAGLLWLHDNDTPPQKCPYLRGLRRERKSAWTAAAILRLAVALDAQRSQSTRIIEVQPSEGGLRIIVGGPQSIRDASAAAERLGLWQQLYAAKLDFVPAVFVPGIQDEAKADLMENMRRGPGIEPTEAMSEAGRKVLYYHFLRMIEQEKGTRLGQDVEALHDMRVATRRMRAALRVFGPYFVRKQIAPFLKGLRRTAAHLGAVRDLDVFLLKATAYANTLPEEERPSLSPLMVAWRTAREHKRRQMLAFLDSDAYRAFCREFGAFLQTERAGARPLRGRVPRPLLVAHVAPSAIYERLAEVRAFDPFLNQAALETYHMLRIYFKRLRYTLEFFQEVLGPEGAEVIRQVTAMQDHLGELQDACVATDMLRGFLNDWAEREKQERSMQHMDIHGVTQYLAANQSRIHELLAGFPEAWAAFNAAEVRQALAQAVAVL